jgi:hypothetical protein
MIAHHVVVAVVAAVVVVNLANRVKESKEERVLLTKMVAEVEQQQEAEKVDGIVFL